MNCEDCGRGHTSTAVEVYRWVRAHACGRRKLRFWRLDVDDKCPGCGKGFEAGDRIVGDPDRDERWHEECRERAYRLALADEDSIRGL